MIAVLAVMSCVFLMGAGLFMVGRNAIADEPGIEFAQGVTLEQSYVVGTTLNVPSANIIVGENSYEATTVYLYTPSGKLLSVGGSSYDFDEIGTYTLVYVALVGNKQVSFEQPIDVLNTSYVATDLTKIDNLEKLSVLKDTDKKGIKVSIPYMDTFKWSTPVNLAETGLSTPLISFLPYQYSKEKVAENGVTPNQATEIYVRLTDAYNPSVYVDVRMEYEKNGNEANQMPAYSAGAARQQIRAMSTNLGRDSRDGKIMFVGADRYFVTYQERGGYPYLGGIVEESSLINLFYDVNTNQVYVGETVIGPDGYQVKLINDIDAPEIYGENAFAGFTTGEVYVSIYGKRFVSTDLRLDLEIASIGKQVGEDLYGATAEDTTPPELKVDLTLDQEDNGLFVAKGSEVRILDADVKDVNFTGNKFNIKVNYNDVVDVTVTDGKFIAKDIGKYTITYTAEDDFGNPAEKVVVYNCIDRVDNDGKLIEFAVDDYAGEKKAGEVITLPAVDIYSPNKYVNLNVYAYFGNDTANKIAIDNETMQLKIDNVGKYTIVYEYSDIFESGVTTKEFVSEAGDRIDLLSAALPKYMIKNAKYSLDKVYARTYVNETPTLNEVSYQISEDGGEYKSVVYADYKVVANETVQFKYTYGTEVRESEVIKVVDVNFGRGIETQKYFQGEVTPEQYSKDKTKFAFIANEESGNATFDFVNVLTLKNFELNFEIDNDMRNFKGVEIEITDYLNRDNKVTIRYADSGSGTSFQVIGGLTVLATRAFSGTKFALTYSNSRKAFEDSTLEASSSWASNFESDRVLVKITITDITGRAGIVISSIGGNNINTTKSDSVAPILSYNDAFKGNQSVGTKITVGKSTATDVLSPAWYGAQGENITVIVEKQTEDESITMVSDDGVELFMVTATRDYEITLTEIGEYLVTYLYADQNSVQGLGSYTVNIVDEVKPEIEIEGGYNEFTVLEAEVGDIITAAYYEISDNNDLPEDMVVSVVVIDPFFTMYDLIPNNIEIDDMKFTIEYRGEYVVYYYVEDTSGNVATASYRIFVK